MGNLNLTYLWRIKAYANVCSAYIAFLTYEGLTCNVRVTYAERMPGALGASMTFIDFMASNISGRFIRDLSNKPSVSLIILTTCTHTLVSISKLFTVDNYEGRPCSDSIIFS